MTNDDRNQIWRLHHAGFTPAQIAEATGLPMTAVKIGLADPSPKEIERLKMQIRCESMDKQPDHELRLNARELRGCGASIGQIAQAMGISRGQVKELTS